MSARVINSILKDTLIAEVAAPIALGSSIDQDTDTLDMQGYDGVIFITPITDSVATGVATLTAKQGDASNGSDAAALTGAVATGTSATNDDLNNKLLIVDVIKPTKRYVTATLTSATANIAYGNTLAIRYRSDEQPVTADASVQQGVVAYSPAES